jgi:predicted kinase
MKSGSTKKPIAYLICGFIGAGKTTFARKLETETGAIRITKDEWMVRIFGSKITSNNQFAEYDKNVTALTKEVAFKILERGKDVIIDEGFWEKSYRNEIKKQLSELGAISILYYVECPVEKMRKRTVARSKNLTKDSFEISGEMFDSYVKYWEPPSKDEEFIVAK